MSDQDVGSAGCVSSAPVNTPGAMAHERLEIGPAVPSVRPPLISDDEQDMVESFVAGYCFCPEDYREVFYESWAKSHPEDRRLLFTTWLAIEHLEEIRSARGKVAGR